MYIILRSKEEISLSRKKKKENSRIEKKWNKNFSEQALIAGWRW